MFFSVITKNLNWKLLTMNLVTFKRWDGVKDHKFYGGLMLWGFTEKSDFKGGCHKKLIYGWDYLKKGTCTVCRFKKGLGE